MDDRSAPGIEAREYETLLCDLRCLTDEMQSLAGAGDWESLKARENRRQMLLSKLFADSVPASLIASVHSCLADILAANTAIITSCRAGRSLVGEQLEALGQSRKAQAAYSALGD